jgi:hydroxyacylglutathione hydrolase
MQMTRPDISAIPGFTDNYFWLLSAPTQPWAAVVDPGDAVPVQRHLQQTGLQLEAILITHKHGDHTGGIRALKDAWPQAVVYGPAGESIAYLDQRLQAGDQVILSGLACTLQVLEVPGHTEGHLAYMMPGRVFCGDTLFAGGCGRVFGGTFAQLSASLQQLAQLPPDTLIYCAHEYTQANLGFAQWVEPENPQLQARIKWVAAQRERGEATVPSTLAEELATNPFLRTSEPSVIAAAETWAQRRLTTPAAVFTALRTWKDQDYD